MKAVELTACGPPSVLQLRTDYPKPALAGNCALVRIQAAGINPVDLQTREGGVIKPLVAARKVCRAVYDSESSQNLPRSQDLQSCPLGPRRRFGRSS